MDAVHLSTRLPISKVANILYHSKMAQYRYTARLIFAHIWGTTRIYWMNCSIFWDTMPYEFQAQGILNVNQVIFGKFGPLLFPNRTHIWHMHDLILAFRFPDTNSITIFMRKERIQTRKRGKCFFSDNFIVSHKKSLVMHEFCVWCSAVAIHFLICKAKFNDCWICASSRSFWSCTAEFSS